MNLEIGSTVGDYQIIGVLGAGGMGKVFKVKNLISDRVEAMKVLLPDLATEPELADRFVREIKVLASLEHPGIATLRTALRVENQLLMVMELVEGETLEQILAKGRLPAQQAVSYIAEALGALGYAHQRGVVHRDFKPANMMRTPQGVIKLMDFGIAKAAGDRRLTMTGFTMGSLYYMSPEQIEGASTLDARADLYSVGVSLYELVTGKRPFDGDSQFAIMSAHLKNTPVPPITLDPTLPAALNEIILRSIAKDREARFQNAEEFRQALLSVFQTKAPVVETAAPPPAQDFRLIDPTAPEPSRSRRGLWMATGGVAAALALVAVIQFGPWKSTRADVAQPPASPAMTPAPSQNPPAAAVPAASEPAPSAPQAGTPQASTPQASTPQPSAPQASPPPARSNPPQRRVELPARQAGGTDQQQAPRAPNVAQQTPPQQSIPQQSTPPPSAPPPAQPDPAKLAALQELREQLAMLATRAGSCNSGLRALSQQQAASGLALRGDITEAANLMNTYLEGARQALNAGDSGSVKRFMEKAERQVEKIEKFLGQ